jgi:hypothetical protein
MDESSLTRLNMGRVVQDFIGRHSIQNQSDGKLRVRALGQGHQKLLGKIDEFRLPDAFCQTGERSPT